MGRLIAGNKHTGTLHPVDSKAIYRIIYEVVNELPTENIKKTVIYCVPIIGKDSEYDMYLYINDEWAALGSGSADLSDYYTKEEIADILGDYYDKVDIDELVSTKMDLAPLNPTAEEIAALSNGQIYDEASDGVVTIKGGTELLGVLNNGPNPEYGSTKGRLGQFAYYGGKFYQCFGRNEQDTGYVWKLITFADSDVITARATTTGPSGDYIISSSTTLYEVWKLFTKYHCVKVALTDQLGIYTGEVCLITNVTGGNHEFLSAFILPSPSYYPAAPVDQRIHFLEQNASSSSDTLRLVTKYVYPPYEEYYTKTEIDSMIPTVPTNISAFTNDSGYLTLGTLPIYDGTVI